MLNNVGAFWAVMGRADEVTAALDEVRPGLEALVEVGDLPLCVRQDGGIFAVSDLIALFYRGKRP